MNGEIIRDAGMIADEINAIKQEVRDTAIRGAIEIGKRLLEAKSLVPYGSWGKWLQDNVDYSERTAQDLMRIANEYGRRETQALAEIQNTTQAVLLLALDGAEREQFVQEHDMATISTRELEEELRLLKEEKAKAQLTIEELMGQLNEMNAQPEAEPVQPEDHTEELMAARAHAQELLKQLEAAQKEAQLQQEMRETADQAREKAVEARDAMQKQLNGQKTELAKMEADLKEAREKVQTVEVVPEAVEREMETLRRKAAASGAESEMRAAFDGLKAAFERLVDKLGEAEETETETALKYRSAFYRAMLTMAERVKA